MLQGWIACRAVSFALGVASASVLREVAGAPLQRAARAVGRELIRGGLIASREIKRMSEGLTQEIEDMTAEVRAELDRDREAASESAAQGNGPAKRNGRPPRARKA
jgi:hypothetical protein